MKRAERHRLVVLRLAALICTAVAVWLTATSLPAAEIKRVGLPGSERIRIKGPIEPGDDTVFTALLDAEPFPDGVIIDSAGDGDLPAALSIGTIVRQTMLPVSASHHCGAGCTLIWVAGVQRTTRTPLDPSGLAPLTSAVSDYLEQMGIPTATAAELIGSAPLSPEQAHERLGTVSTEHEARLAERCGALSLKEQQDWASIRALAAVDSSLNAMTTGMGGQAMYVVDPETERLAATARELPAAYRRDVEARRQHIDTCRREAVTAWRQAVANQSAEQGSMIESGAGRLDVLDFEQ